MRFTIFLIFCFFFVSEIRESAICVESLEDKESLRLPISDFSLKFKHSIHGGDVVLKCRISDGKIEVRSLESNDEATISYYTDEYSFMGDLFVAKIEEKIDVIIINEGWEIKINGKEFETKSESRIFLCR